jgi:toxin ParE1/3/4
MTPVTFRPRAEQDLNDIEEELAKRYSPQVATKFIQAANETWDLLENMPEVGAPRRYRNRKLLGLRMWPMRRFEKYLVFYRALERSVDVVRVLHSSRDIRRILEEET